MLHAHKEMEDNTFFSGHKAKKEEKHHLPACRSFLVLFGPLVSHYETQETGVVWPYPVEYF